MLPRILFAFSCLLAAMPLIAKQPNIVLIMADDVGIEGLGCYGGTSYKTPNLDRMAAEGIRFTHAYSQPLCTPTRVQIMTGKYNHRNWKYFGILDPEATTFGHLMKSAGYTTGIFGKWQLYSYDPPDLPGASNRRSTGMHPKDAGFDQFALYHALQTEDKGSRYTNPTMLEGESGGEGELRTYPGKYGEDVWVDKILGFMEVNRDQPTFAYYPMALPHWPFVPTPDTPGWDPSSPQPEEYRYIKDMIEYMDVSVGNLMQGLEEKGLDENTIVLFYSDNGTHAKVVSGMDDGREILGGKATPKQTGIHVPLIAHWPGHFKPGVSNAIVDPSDFVPTLLDLAQSPKEAAGKIDGISFAHRLLGQSGSEREAAFVWYDPRPGWDKERFDRHVFAVNRDYKLFSSGRLFRLTDKPLEEIEVNPLAMTEADQAAKRKLGEFIGRQLEGVQEPPLVDAYGRPQLDLLYYPKDKAETADVTKAMLATGKEIVYGDPQIPQHRLWIFNPMEIQADEQRPCVFLIHGGGWGGRPESLAAQALYWQRRGLNAVSIHFRAPSGELTPADTLRDARRAYRWIVEHGKDHHIDVDQLLVSGGSAGGHLSLALATIELEDDPVIEHLPKAMVLFNPVIDLVDGWENGRKKCERANIEPQAFSPAHHPVANLPPILILSGSDDGLISPALIRGFQERMKAAGNSVEFVEYPDAGHGFFNYGRHDNQYFQWTMWEFEKFLNKTIDR
ncbi:MAG: sulfatase-like hydrolase/transferase [Rubripirellula sp.]